MKAPSRQELVKMWDDTKFYVDFERSLSLKELCDNKACALYQAIWDTPAGDAFDAKSVRLTLGEVLSHYLAQVRAFEFCACIIRYYTAMPEYPDYH